MKISDFDAIKKFPFIRSDRSTNEVRLRELDWLMPQINDRGHKLEFGVFSGETINHMANLRPDLKFTGFDSFEGLPEDFDAGEKIVPANAFDRGGIPPEVEDNVTLIKGWFDDTLQPWIDEQLTHLTRRGPDISFVNMDADIYSSTSYVLNTINDFIKPGTVIRFDELSCWRYVFSEASSKNIQRVYYTSWKEHEWKAMNEWLEDYDRKVIPICRNWHQAATVVVTQ
jgi:hypothetical protein